jgi:hypothetical protein
MSNNLGAATAAVASDTNSPMSSHGGSGECPSSAPPETPPIDRFYGREQEEATLFQLFHQCIGRSKSNTGAAKGCQRQDCTSPPPLLSVATATPPSTNGSGHNECSARRSRLVLVQGPKGVGKRTLSQRLRTVVQQAGGLFVSVSLDVSNASGPVDSTSASPHSPSTMPPLRHVTETLLFQILQNLVRALPEDKWNTVRDEISQRCFTEPSELQVLAAVWAALPTNVPYNDMAPTQSARTTICSGQPAVCGESLDAEHSAIFVPETFNHEQSYAASATPRLSIANSNSTTRTTSWGSHTTDHDHDEILVRFIVGVATLMPLVLHIDAAQNVQITHLAAVQRLVYQRDGSHTTAKQGLLVILCSDMNISSTKLDAPESESDSLPISMSHGALASQRNRDRTKPILENIRCCGRIQLENLSRDHVQQWIADWSKEVKNANGDHGEGDGHAALAQSRDLIDLVFQRTMGNPRHVYFMLLLFQLEYLGDDFVQSGMDQICQRLPSAPCQLFQQVVQRQAPLVQVIIETVAALIECDALFRVTLAMLELVTSQPCSQALSIAVEYRLLSCQQGRYHFTDSLFQSAAYAIMPESKRSKVHLRIGRRIWKYSSLGGAMAESTSLDTETLLFAAARQLEKGTSVVTDPNERDFIAKIQWEAGKRAMQLSEFSGAAAYFECAISILCSGRTWRADQYDLTLALHNGAAEAYYCTGDFVRTDQMLEKVFENATTFEDKLQAYSTLVFALGARHRLSEAVTTALEVLGRLNVSIPTNPSRMLVFIEYVKTRYLLRGKNDRFFLNLPLATNSDIIAAMTLLNFTILYSYAIKPEWGALAVFRLIHLALQHGLCGSALAAFSGYGLLLASLFGNIEEGYRFGQIALALSDLVESKAWLPRVYFMVYGFIDLWINPFRESMEPLLFAQRSALKTGDIEGSVTCATVYLMSAFLRASRSMRWALKPARFVS